MAEKSCLIILLLVFLTKQAVGQSIIEGRVLSQEDTSSIEGTHIYNLSNEQMAISLSDGSFVIQAEVSDTLYFSNINFDNRQFIIKNLAYSTIYLTPSNIQLEEVVVNNLPETAADFKKKLIGMEHQETNDFVPYGMKAGKPRGKVPAMYNLEESKSLGSVIFHPLRSAVRAVNKEYKNKAKYYILKAEKQDKVSADKKFNRELVQELTSLEAEELTDFIKYLDIDPGFVERASSYEIAVYVKEQYQLYTKEK